MTVLGEAAGYVQLLNISPYGAILRIETFDQTEGAGASDLFMGTQSQRVIAGHSNQTVTLRDALKPDAEATTVKDMNGWVMAAVPFKSADDVCAVLQPGDAKR